MMESMALGDGLGCTNIEEVTSSKGNDREDGIMATVAEIFGDTRSIVFHLLLHLNTPNTYHSNIKHE